MVPWTHTPAVVKDQMLLLHVKEKQYYKDPGAVLLFLFVLILVLCPLILSNVAKFPATTTIGRLSVEGNEEASCHFEDAKGHYEVVNGTWSWNWIHNASASSTGSSTGKNCTISDYITALIHDEYKHTKPLHIITLGDSLDWNIIVRYICEPLGDAANHGFVLLPPRRSEDNHSDDPIDENLFNTAQSSDRSSALCTNGKTSFAHLKIFGMHHCCENSNTLFAEDSRRFNTTKDRVAKLLDFEILSRLPRNTSNFVVMVSSALWDLSAGCNNQLGISDEYRQLYETGMLDLHNAIRKLLPNAPIYWKTSPPVSAQYDKKNKLSHNGRTRSNQADLNGLMRMTVAQHNLGVVVDWWVLAKTRPESERGVYPDGRHYNQNSSMVFYNLFLNALFDHHPHLVRP